MSCWVAPTIAADYCGLNLHEILAMIARGQLQTSSDLGFRFIRLPRFSDFGKSLPLSERPPTFYSAQDASDPEKCDDVVTPQERDALMEESPIDNSELGPPPDEDPADNRIAGWREGRSQTSKRRRGPPSPT